MLNNDITIIYYTSNYIKEEFASKTREMLLRTVGDIQIISVSQKPMNLGRNICMGNIGRTHFNIYRQALVGAKEAKTEFIALVEDDVLYTPEHFQYRPKDNVFAYNVNIASIYTWSNPPVFSFKDRRVLHSLVCPRQLFIDAMEERFVKYPNPDKSLIYIWGEPGRLEKNLGVTIRSSEKFKTERPNIAFCTEQSLAFEYLGTRKKLGNRPTPELPYWGRAEDLLNIFWK